MKDMVATIHSNQDELIDIRETLQDMLTLFGQLYTIVHQSAIPVNSKFKIVRFSERFALLEYDLEEIDDDDTASELSPSG